MNVTLNGNSIQLQADTSLLTLLGIKGLEPERIVIEYNNNILNKEEWGSIVIKENDKVEVLSFVRGG